MVMSLAALLAAPGFQLRLLESGSEEALHRPVSWVHNSDFPDPTPWLEAGQVLLTDGDYFRTASDAAVDAYVRRLRARGILALGFATGILHDTVPDALRRACRLQGLPLFEVADRTPFMAITRFVADDIAQDRRAGAEASLEAQRAVARAALRPDGLTAILLELEQRLDCWVALYDSRGTRVPTRTRRGVPDSLRDAVDAEVARVLGRGTRAGGRVSGPEGVFTVQSIGRRGRLSGVLAVGASTALDAAGSDLVRSVLALAGIALEQSRDVEQARVSLRAGVVDLLRSGHYEAAARTAGRAGSPLPRPPFRVGLLAASASASGGDGLAVGAARSAPGGAWFTAPVDRRTVVVVGEEAVDEVRAILERGGAAAALSAPVTGWDRFAVAFDQARVLLDRTEAGGARSVVVAFDDRAADGVLGLIDPAEGAAVARALLAPLLDDPMGSGADGRILLLTAGAWLRHNSAADPTARELDVHRHTVTARIAAVEQRLGLDLGGIAGRAELWAALRLAAPELLGGRDGAPVAG